ncbi:MAG: hypothetical protein HZA53_04865 [Planctomycetes bacterium]|nr:hypothetical protein [Planctomycetota bacterium]
MKTLKEPTGLARVLAIVLATIAGSTGCWLWVFFLMALPRRSVGAYEPAPWERGARTEWFLADPKLWGMGAACGLLFVVPALLCLWPRRLVPALIFVFAIGYGAATGMLGATALGGGLQALESALPVTAYAPLGALVFVRCVPLPIWTLARAAR